MSNAKVITDGASFKCAHMPAPLGVSQGISISLTAQKISVDGAKPVLQGAIISGFTVANGCTFQVAGAAAPCVSFLLAAVPATGLLSENNQNAYIDADAQAIGMIPATGNAQPGLSIVEPQNKLKA